MHYSSTFVLSALLLFALVLMLGACDTVDDPPEEPPGDPVFTLDDIDGSWQQEDDENRHLDIRSDAGDDGIFYEAYFRSEDDDFDVTNCWYVVENRVLTTNEGTFTIEVHEEGEDPYQVQISFEVQATNADEPERVRMIRQDNSFDAWFHPATQTIDDFQPRCEDVEEDEPAA